MKKIVFGLLISFCFSAQAQITIDQADMPNAGDSTARNTATNFTGKDFVTTGANFVWNFGDLTPGNLNKENYFPISAAPLFTQFVFNSPVNPNSKSQIFIDGQNPVNFGAAASLIPLNIDSTFEFYKKTATRYARTGFSIRLNGFDLPLAYDSNDVEYKLPMNFGGIDSCLSIFEIKSQFLPFLYYNSRQKRVNNIDGWGTLNLPNGFNYQVLRVKSVLLRSDTVRIDTGFIHIGFRLPTVRTVEYKWLAKGKQTPIMEATGTENAGVFTPTTVRFYNQFSVSIENVKAEEIAPVFTTQTIDASQLENLKSMRVINIHGQQLLSSTSSIISTDNLPKGIYTVQLLFENGKVGNWKFAK